MGYPFGSLPAGNQAAVLAAQGNNQPNAAASGGAVAAPMTGSAGGMPPTNDIVNAGLNIGGLAAPLGFGTIASLLKGFFQQAFSGDEANTNPMSLGESAIYGPGLGERMANWLSDMFSGNADPNPPNAQVTSSPAQYNPSSPPSGLDAAVNSITGSSPSGGQVTSSSFGTGMGNLSGPGFFGGLFGGSNPSTSMQMGESFDLGSFGDISQASKGMGGF